MRVLLAVLAVVAVCLANEFVHVPGGRMAHRSCIHQVTSGSEVGENKDGSAWSIDAVTGARTEYAPCKFKSYSLLDAPQYVADGYVAHVSQFGTPQIGFMHGNWTVPPSPSKPSTNASASVIYLWLGTQDALSNVDVIQPVLQYGGGGGSGGGNYWMIASWWVTSQDKFFVSKPINTTVGSPIYGVVEQLANSSWSIAGYPCDGCMPSTLIVNNNRAHSQSTVLVAMEAYAIKECVNLPATTGETFTGVEVFLTSKKPFSPSWTVNIDDHECKANAKVNSNTDIFIGWTA